MQYCSDKDMNQLVKRMVRTGWTFEHGKHGKLRHPTGIGFITFPRTPSDHRSLLTPLHLFGCFDLLIQKRRSGMWQSELAPTLPHAVLALHWSDAVLGHNPLNLVITLAGHVVVALVI